MKLYKRTSIFHGVITWEGDEMSIVPETAYEDSCAYTSNTLHYVHSSTSAYDVY